MGELSPYYELLLHSAGEGIIGLDARGRHTFVNQSAAAMLGYEVAELIGRPSHDLWHHTRADGAPFPETDCPIYKSFTSGQLYREDNDYFWRKDGGCFAVSYTCTPVWINDRIDGAVVVFQDVEARKQQERQLAWEAIINKALADLSQAIISSTAIEDISAVVLEKAQMLTQSPFGFVGYIDPQTGWMVSPTLTRDIWKTCCMDNKDVVFKTFSGLWGWVLQQKRSLICNSPATDSHSGGVPEGHIPITRFLAAPAIIDGQVVGQVALANKAADYDEKELALVERLADLYAIAAQRYHTDAKLRKLELAVEQSPVSIVITDTKGAIEYVNPKFEQVTGYTYDEARGQNPSILKSGHKPDAEYAALWQSISDGREWRGEFHNKKKNGELYWEYASISPIRNHKGVITHYVAIKEDVTHIKQTEKDLQKAKEAAEAASLAKSQFLANMSHEVRTPMNGIIGMTGLLLDTDLAPRQREYANTIRNSADALLNIINDILDFSKIEAGKLELEALNFDLTDTVEDMAEILAVKAHEKGLHLICYIEPDTPRYLCGDPGRLRQILTNLTGNAIKFTTEGEVVIRVGKSAYSHALPTTQTDAETAGEDFCTDDMSTCVLKFSVSDTGMGIAPEQASRLFDIFTQVDSSITRRFGGTGLGLSISKLLVEMMGGCIWVESQPGEGSTFHFTAMFKKQPLADTLTSASFDLRDLKVLVVDDNATNRLVLCEYLRLWECVCAEAETGAAALQMLRKAAKQGEPFQAAVLDMLMPAMDGEELGVLIKRDEQIKDTFLVMLTSHGMAGDIERCRQIGFQAYMTKPVRISILYEYLARAAGHKVATFGPGDNRFALKSCLTPEARRALRILIAEDNITNQKVTLGILQRVDLRADVVADGKEVLEAVRQIPYDIILMDVQMPEMDGLEATRHIRQQEVASQQHIIIIAMTAHAMKTDKERCLEAGMDAYISKPVDARELIATIERFACETADAPAPESGDAPIQTSFGEVFDISALLERVGDDPELAAEIVAIFLRDFPQQMQKLRQALSDAHSNGLRETAHSIKGAAANIGADRIRQKAHQLEIAAREEHTQLFEALVQSIQQEHDRFREAVVSSSGLNVKHWL